VKQNLDPKTHRKAVSYNFENFKHLFVFVCFFAFLIPSFSAAQIVDRSPFELKNGDRVVFLGNALVENEQEYNYLEFRLTRHWPNRSITFRNLGWSGDNVFGEARSYYTSPPSPYDLLISQLTEAKPTHVLIAYGSVEAQGGKDGLEAFEEGLKKLLSKIQDLGAEAILLSPMPQFGGGTPTLLEERNQNLKLYADLIAEIANSSKKRFIDLYTPMDQMNEQELLSENGVHLTDYGYYKLAEFVEAGLGLKADPWQISINAVSGTIEGTVSTHSFSHDSRNSVIQFNVEESLLPVPSPASNPAVQERLISVKGLKKGNYSLEIDGKLVASASAKAWADGIYLQQGGMLDQSKQLKHLLNKKDEVFFFQYRPLNRTYIIGFREYEQGRHVKDLEDFDIVLTWLQGQITAAKSPTLNQYRLYPIQ
jgi:lysophospholipase L1-like esterase